MGRPRSRLLSTDFIVDAAIDVADETGVLAIAPIAARLGVAPSSLYNHVAGRSEIIEMVRSKLADEFEPLEQGLAWSETLIRTLRRLREMWAQHPKLVPILFETPVTGLSALHIYDDLATKLLNAGLPAEEVLPVMGTIDAFTLGAAVDFGSADAIWDLPSEASLPGLRAGLEASGTEARAERAFELGLAIIVEGIRGRLIAGPEQPKR